MVQDEDKTRIDNLNNSLYSRNAPDVRSRRKMRIEDVTADVPTAWQRPPEVTDAPLPQTPKKHPMSFFIKFFVASIIFFIAAVGIGAYIFLNGNNLISANNIDITISGPVSVPGGSPVTFEIAVTNKNTVDLDQVDLEVNFPAGSTNVNNPTQPLTTYRDVLGSIASGATVKKTVSATIFGEQNTQKTVTVDVGYKVKGSTSPFSKEKTYDVLINSSPINLTVTSFKEITSGQEFDITFRVKSNSTDTLRNVMVSATYPFGFSYLSSSIAPLGDKATWRLGDIPPGGEKNIVVHGKLQGENQDMRVFHVSVGTQNPRNPNSIGTEFMNATQEIALKKSFMTIGLNIDNNQTGSDVPGVFNQPVRADINWFNNLPTAVTDAEITVKLSGSAYDRTLVQPSKGLFRSSTDEIVWTSQSDPSLGAVGAGESGTVSFTVTPRDMSTPSRPIVNPTLTLSVSVKGKRVQESGVPQTLSSIVTRNVRISSSVALSGQVVRNATDLRNTGPIPPKADQKTTYTVIWSIDNTANSLSKAQVTATLPQYVKWVGDYSPSGEDISYDNRNGLVTWNAGSVGTYTATRGQRKTVAFQISLEPNINQVGSIPVLVNDATLTATDEFTGATLNSVQSYLTTRFSTDASYKPGDETVQP